MARELISSNTEWERVVGYSRAVRDGRHLFISGTTATDSSGKVVGVGDLYVQTVQVLKNIGEALAKSGLQFESVIRTRMFVTDISRWREVARAHSEVFCEIRPATTMVEVQRLIDPAMLIEIEADALAPE